MQNGDEFWVIDMALSKTSHYMIWVPQLRRRLPENWLPTLK